MTKYEQPATTKMATELGFVAGVAWETESPFLDIDYEERADRGVPSLKHLATKKLLSDQRNLQREHFRYVAWPIAEQLWLYLTRRYDLFHLSIIYRLGGKTKKEKAKKR